MTFTAPSKSSKATAASAPSLTAREAAPTRRERLVSRASSFCKRIYVSHFPLTLDAPSSDP